MEQETQQEITQDDVELAQMIAAAYITHRLGRKSIDTVRKQYCGPSTTIAPIWIELARIAKTITPSVGVPFITSRTQ